MGVNGADVRSKAQIDFLGGIQERIFKLVYAVRSERSESHRIPPFEQGKMTMGEYETKFRELSRYAPHLVAN